MLRTFPHDGKENTNQEHVQCKKKILIVKSDKGSEAVLLSWVEITYKGV